MPVAYSWKQFVEDRVVIVRFAGTIFSEDTGFGVLIRTRNGLVTPLKDSTEVG